MDRGGTGTLFRWGDAWQRGLPRGTGGVEGHHARNVFRLQLLADPYQVECVEEMDGFVGGDGGSALCGDRPELETWVSFASAYRYPMELVDDDAYAEFWTARGCGARCRSTCSGAIHGETRDHLPALSCSENPAPVCC